MLLRPVKKKARGQSTVEYILMMAFGAYMALQVGRIFTGIFQDGLTGLEQNVQGELATGHGFGP
jgi:hypothetical protein